MVERQVSNNEEGKQKEMSKEGANFYIYASKDSVIFLALEEAVKNGFSFGKRSKQLLEKYEKLKELLNRRDLLNYSIEKSKESGAPIGEVEGKRTELLKVEKEIRDLFKQVKAETELFKYHAKKAGVVSYMTEDKNNKKFRDFLSNY